MRREITAISNALRKQQYRVSLNKTWSGLHESRGVGQVIGRTLHLTNTELESLRKWVVAEAGIDPLLGSNVADERMVVAETGRDEKLARNKVFGGMMHIARMGIKPIRINGGQAIQAPGSHLLVDEGAVDFSGERVVVVENGALVRHWDRLELPVGLEDALIVYRGHEYGAIPHLRQQPGIVELLAFLDFDPAGLRMACDGSFDSIIIPTQWEQLTASSELVKKFNQPDKFYAQLPALSQIRTQGRSLVALLVDHLRQQRMALMQEHLVVHRVPLSRVDLSD